MPSKEQIDYYHKRLEENINSFYSKRSDNRIKAFRFQLLISCLSALATILLGLKLVLLKDVDRDIALVLSSIVTVISGADAFYDHKGLWRNYTETLNELYSLKDDFEFRLLSDTPVTDDEMKFFLARREDVLRQNNQQWKKLRK